MDIAQVLALMKDQEDCELDRVDWNRARLLEEDLMCICWWIESYCI